MEVARGRALPGGDLRPARARAPTGRSRSPRAPPGGRTTLDGRPPRRARRRRRDQPARPPQPREPGRRHRRRLRPGRRAAAIARAARGFPGVRRRQELRGVARGVTVVDDFAHHPTAVRETVAGAQGPVRRRQADRGLRAALGDQPAHVFQARVRRRVLGRRRGGPGAALRAREGPGGRTPRRREAGRRSARARTCRPADPTVDDTVDHLAERAAPGDTVVVMSSGDFGGMHDKLLRRLGDPVMPARAEHKVRSRTCSTGSGSRTRCSNSSGPAIWSSRARRRATRWSGASPSRSSARWRSCECWRSRPSARRGPGLRAGRIGDRTGPRAGGPPSVPRHRRRPGLLRREARLPGDRSEGGRSRRSRRPPNTCWRDRRARPGCGRSCRRCRAGSPETPLRSPRRGASRGDRHRRRGGKGSGGRVGDPSRRRFKSEDINLVTEYDRRSEKLIVERLARGVPRRSDRRRGRNQRTGAAGAQRVWYVDPLDGTTNFAHGFPLFSVSIGLCINRRPVLGVIGRRCWAGRFRARRPAGARR